MPRSSSPYNWRYMQARRALLAHGGLCELRLVCGGLALGTTADHVPPLALHHHVPGSGCCYLQPACRPCQNEQATRIRRMGRARRRAHLPRPSRVW